jgi:hypothetical protein
MYELNLQKTVLNVTQTKSLKMDFSMGEEGINAKNVESNFRIKK